MKKYSKTLLILEWFPPKTFYKLPVSAEQKSWRFPYFFKSYRQTKIVTLLWATLYSWNPSTCTCKNRKYLKSIAGNSVIACDGIIFVMDIVSTKKTITIGTNATKICHSKKVRDEIDCHILHTVWLVIMLLLIIIITCYQYVKVRSKQKGIYALTIQKWKKRIYKSLF